MTYQTKINVFDHNPAILTSTISVFLPLREGVCAKNNDLMGPLMVLGSCVYETGGEPFTFDAVALRAPILVG